MKQDAESLSVFIRQEALSAGFAACGISRAVFLEEEAPRLEHWLREGFHGRMKYMENNFDKRLDPRLLVDDAHSVISLLYYYDPLPSYLTTANYRLARFALGKDYHFVLKEKMNALAEAIKKQSGDFAFRIFTDSAPVLERAWAVKAGLGFIGKNTHLILPRRGSWFLLGEIICDLELAYDRPAPNDLCGDCRRCIDACPTGAIQEGNTLEARKCISYLTTELKEDIPEAFKGETAPWIFGCDICQEVCPWNRFSKGDNVGWLSPNPALPSLSKEQWENMSRETWKQLFRESGLRRAGYERLMRNVRFASSEE